MCGWVQFKMGVWRRNRGLPPPSGRKSDHVKVTATDISSRPPSGRKSAPPEILERTRRIERVLARHGVALQAAALRFPLLHPAVATVIPGLLGAAEVHRTIEAFAVDIPQGCWNDLAHEGLIDAPGRD